MSIGPRAAADQSMGVAACPKSTWIKESGACEQFSIEYLIRFHISLEANSRFWKWFWGKVHKASSAGFWAATGILFNSMKTSMDRSITLQLPGNEEDKKEEGESRVLKAVQDELQKLSKQQADGLAEGFKNLQKMQSAEWRLIRQELSIFRVTAEASLLKALPKSLVIRDMVNPDHYVPPFAESNKSDFMLELAL
ncbi:hypothetical protein EJB05_02387 [Eragrostis curvula]|uniref:Uncharacterized protein n=1 Tax=Eragrostis curvula TaxID=38414 RepID=A0A5J9WST4_9POAL|nr:hypothetical protein EJB05_02387 [Eragrostis curvula]